MLTPGIVKFVVILLSSMAHVNLYLLVMVGSAVEPDIKPHESSEFCIEPIDTPALNQLIGCMSHVAHVSVRLSPVIPTVGDDVSVIFEAVDSD